MGVEGIGGGAAELTQTMLGGQMQMADQAMQMAKVGMQMEMQVQQMAQAQEVVAMMTGVGSNLNSVA